MTGPIERSREDFEGGIFPPVKTLRELLDQKPYEMVSSIVALLHVGDEKLVGEVFSYLVEQNPTRLAIVVGDVFTRLRDNQAFRSFKAIQRDHQALEIVKDLVVAGSSSHVLREELLHLPTRDAHRCRTELFGIDSDRSIALAIAAILSLKGEEEVSLGDLITCVGSHGSRPSLEGERLPLCERIRRTLEERFYVREEPRPLSLQHQQIVDEFYRLAEDQFSLETYGYHRVADGLQLDQELNADAYLVGGETERQHRLRAKLFLSKVFVPWPATPDIVNHMAHQCVDSASVARSYFVARGIPSDVYLVKVGSFYHNVAVAFLPDHGKYNPCVVDASPFRASYELLGKGSPTLWSPQGINAVLSLREEAVPFAQGYFGGDGRLGLLPWFCADSDDGRIIGCAGVHDKIIDRASMMERGADEYYGRGERERYPAILLTVLKRGFEERSMLFGRDASGEVILRQQRGELSGRIVDFGRDLAREHLPSIEAAVARMKIPVGRVTW